MSALFAKPNAPKLFASQIGWQEVLVRLFILRPKAVNSARRISGISNPVSGIQTTDIDTTSTEDGANSRMAVGGMVGTLVNISADSGEESTTDGATLLDPSIDICKSDTRDDLSSISSSPKFSRHTFFDDLNLFDPDHFGFGGSSRSSSTSVEDLSFAGRRSTSSGGLSGLSNPSDYNLAALLEEEIPSQIEGAEEEDAGLRRWSDKADLTQEEEAEIVSGTVLINTIYVLLSILLHVGHCTTMSLCVNVSG